MPLKDFVNFINTDAYKDCYRNKMGELTDQVLESLELQIELSKSNPRELHGALGTFERFGFKDQVSALVQEIISSHDSAPAAKALAHYWLAQRTIISARQAGIGFDEHEKLYLQAKQNIETARRILVGVVADDVLYDIVEKQFAAFTAAREEKHAAAEAKEAKVIVAAREEKAAAVMDAENLESEAEGISNAPVVELAAEVMLTGPEIKLDVAEQKVGDYQATHDFISGAIYQQIWMPKATAINIANPLNITRNYLAEVPVNPLSLQWMVRNFTDLGFSYQAMELCQKVIADPDSARGCKTMAYYQGAAFRIAEAERIFNRGGIGQAKELQLSADYYLQLADASFRAEGDARVEQMSYKGIRNRVMNLGYQMATATAKNAATTSKDMGPKQEQQAGDVPRIEPG